MFSKKETIEYNRVTTLLDKDCAMEGVLRSKGTVRIDGEFKGELYIDGNLFVGETGKIVGKIQANNLLIAGAVQGDVSSAEQLRIVAGGSLYGDVSVKSFILDENSIFQGHCQMKLQEEAVPQGQEA